MKVISDTHTNWETGEINHETTTYEYDTNKHGRWVAHHDSRDVDGDWNVWRFRDNGWGAATAKVKTVRTKKDSYMNKSGYRFEVRSYVVLTVNIGTRYEYELEQIEYIGGEKSTVKNLLKQMAKYEFHMTQAVWELQAKGYKTCPQLAVMNAVYPPYGDNDKEATARRLYELVVKENVYA